MKKEYTIIVGCGRLGGNIANTLSDLGEDILIIDKREDSFRKLSRSFGGMTMVGDGADIDCLREAEIQDASTLIVVTENDNANILIAQMAKDFFHTEHVITRLYDPERQCVYDELGIETICPALLSAKEIGKILLGAGGSGNKQGLERGA
ncbi:potassium channel family protein [Anaerostipes sp.]|uniref:potassium channel family protein n=1 Tax=Anaerostipes sp. TaxID=1872530 RepID=UPI0025C60636|nr:TrkA family potassium uptake protein [Anaerostipes sp.]MBS7007707.1 TrkA family potassium uptake protein [Anaerostipes sp.]